MNDKIVKDSAGRIIERHETRGNETVVKDSAGRVIGRVK